MPITVSAGGQRSASAGRQGESEAIRPWEMQAESEAPPPGGRARAKRFARGGSRDCRRAAKRPRRPAGRERSDSPVGSRYGQEIGLLYTFSAVSRVSGKAPRPPLPQNRRSAACTPGSRDGRSARKWDFLSVSASSAAFSPVSRARSRRAGRRPSAPSPRLASDGQRSIAARGTHPTRPHRSPRIRRPAQRSRRPHPSRQPAS